MNILALTSSRADYSIYLPLWLLMNADEFFDLKIIAFGSHFSKIYGHTIDEIENAWNVEYRISEPIETNTPHSISQYMGYTTTALSEFYEKEVDSDPLLLCLGDRYEMFAAVGASIPFNMKLAHIHGGESTEGAIDNAFRNAITAMSHYHFTSTKKHAENVARIKGSDEHVHMIGAMGLDNASDTEIMPVATFNEKHSIDMNKPTVLTTFHPETVDLENTELHAQVLVQALSDIEHQVIITLPNADTMNKTVRDVLINFAEDNDRIFTVESLGTIDYYSCMKHCSFMVGNSSSGIIEAASFGKYVVNIGNRQKGRDHSDNVLHCAIEKDKILQKIKEAEAKGEYTGINIYGDGKSAPRMIDILKTI